MSNIGEKIKNIRIARKMTQQDLAERMNLKRNTISQWESNARNISVEQLMELAKIVGVTLDYFQDNPAERTLFQLMAQLESTFTSADIPEADKDKAYQDIMKIYLRSKEMAASNKSSLVQGIETELELIEE